LVYFLAVY
jgi:hypothetical protein